MAAMKRPSLAAAAVICLTVVVAAQAPPAAQTPAANAKLDAAMRAFWDADDAGDADKAAKQILASGATFEEVRARLKTGRPYAKQKTGRIELPSKDHGLSLDNIVEIPAEYDPARAWPLRVSLHGGVGREAPGPGDAPARPLANRIQSAGEIVLHPRAWAQSQWWNAGQVDKITRLIARLHHRHLGRRHRRVLLRHAARDAVVGLHAAQRPSAGDCQPGHWR
jgi:hypothetical protein